MSDEYDSPWKEVADRLFPQMMALLFPRAYRGIDWSQGWESLDKDLTKLLPDAEAKDRWADKLMRVPPSAEEGRAARLPPRRISKRAQGQLRASHVHHQLPGL